MALAGNMAAGDGEDGQIAQIAARDDLGAVIADLESVLERLTVHGHTLPAALVDNALCELRSGHARSS